jgi:hypothetical protein
MAGGPPVPPDRRPIVGYTMASGDFFALAGLALREGRVFEERDRAGAPQVAVVNEAFVRSVSPDAGVLGRQVTVLGVGAGAMQIVGVVADDVPFRPGEQARPRLFYPYTQSASTRFIGMVRTEEGHLLQSMPSEPSCATSTPRCRSLKCSPSKPSSARPHRHRAGVPLS